VQGNDASSIIGDSATLLARLEALAEAGATWVCLNPPNRDLGACLELLHSYCDEVVSQAREL
jgi:hypothetical protein